MYGKRRYRSRADASSPCVLICFAFIYIYQRVPTRNDRWLTKNIGTVPWLSSGRVSVGVRRIHEFLVIVMGLVES